MVQIRYRFPRPGSQFPVPKGTVHPDKQVITRSNGSSYEPDWQLSYPRLVLPYMRLTRGEPCTFLLLNLMITHCSLAIPSAQGPRRWAVPFGSAGPGCATLVTRLGHWTRTMKSCLWCFRREAQGISITWLCIASLSLQLSFQMWCQ